MICQTIVLSLRSDSIEKNSSKFQLSLTPMTNKSIMDHMLYSQYFSDFLNK